MPTLREYNHDLLNKGREQAQDAAIRQLIEEQNVLVQQVKELVTLFDNMVDALGNVTYAQHNIGNALGDFKRRTGQAGLSDGSEG